MSDLPTPTCPYCNAPAILRNQPAHYRRSDRVLSLDLPYWECPSGCAGPDGEVPFRFADAALLRAHDAAARAAWAERFGEPMPPSAFQSRKSSAPGAPQFPLRDRSDPRGPHVEAA
jgi:hypothetical protein